LGVRANAEVANESAWVPFLHSFLNIQSNDFFDGGDVMVLGHFDFTDMEHLIESNASSFDEKLAAYRHAVNTVDAEVEQLVHIITQNRKMPIVIGGGHNNAYPCIKGAAKGWYKAGVLPIAQLNAVNLDLHAEYAPMEGRHSGNAFRYAEEDGYLEKYCVVGLHEHYIQQNVWMDMVNNPFVDCITYEDIFIHEKRNFIQSIAHATGFTEGTLCGVELDMDCIENGFGITAHHARQYVHFVTADGRPAYLHICGGSQQAAEAGGVLASCIVTDFVKAMNL
jgi:formiminoglutamase